jgi:SRSO17 transposase
MERRFELRLDDLLADSQVAPCIPRGMLDRLERFVEPFAALLNGEERQRHTWEYVAGLVSDVPEKNVEAIAYHHDQDRQALQKFIGQLPWDHRPLMGELARQIGAELGETDGVLVFDPSAFAKRGKHSVGVARQWCGRLGKIENCQVGIYLAYVAHQDHALVDTRLYLPEEWAKDRTRRKATGVPREVAFRTRHALALEMLAEHGSLLPHAWVAGDDEMGRSSRFRRDLRDLGEHYVLAVPSNTTIRDLDAPPPPYRGRGPHPKVPFVRVDRWCTALPEDAWTTIHVRNGDKGPLVVQCVKARVLAKTERRPMEYEEVLLVIRERQQDGTMKHDYHLCHAPPETPLAELVRAGNAEHRVEECLKRAKSNAGLAEYQVRNWIGWHHHQTLALMATWFLTLETQRGKKIHAGDHCAADCDADCLAAA